MPGAALALGNASRGDRRRPSDSVLAKCSGPRDHRESKPLALETLARRKEVKPLRLIAAVVALLTFPFARHTRAGNPMPKIAVPDGHDVSFRRQRVAWTW